jgi:hypothetical protein
MELPGLFPTSKSSLEHTLLITYHTVLNSQYTMRICVTISIHSSRHQEDERKSHRIAFVPVGTTWTDFALSKLRRGWLLLPGNQSWRRMSTLSSLSGLRFLPPANLKVARDFGCRSET